MSSIGRLIPLNKKFPHIPQVDQYRPIVALSPVVKFLEGAIVGYLRNYCKRLPNQFGFIPNLSIQECKMSLINDLLLKRKDNSQYWMAFIDLKSAYDRVDRRILLGIIEKKLDLPPHILDLLKFLLGQTQVQYGLHSIETTNGVPQGSTLSPYLFIIALT